MATVLAVAAIGMLLAGLTAHAIQLQRVDGRIDAALAQEVAEFRALAETGVDPRTGVPFTSVEALFFVALERNIPDRNEGILTMIDDQVELVPAPAVTDVRLEEDAAFVELLREVPTTSRVRVTTADTALGTLHFVAVPVRVAGDPAEGLYAVAFVRDLERADVVASMRTYAAVSVVALVIIGAVGWFVAGRLLHPIRLLSDMAQRISETDLSGRIPVRGSDDISELARTVNAMLDRLEASFAQQRDILDDAGHELRTPITVVRGHLELMDPADDADVTETRALALDELDRMRRLVDDLVLLAKAERPDFVQPGRVELDRLTDEVLDKARPLGPRDWRIDARASGVASLDEQRITQAWLQLIDNAVKFTEPGQVVAVGSEVAKQHVRLWVRDSGPGLAAEDAERIFERFGRVATGRGIEGSGLGLAIVRAIAEAHGGRVWVESTPGRGATFVMEFSAQARVDRTASVPGGEQAWAAS